MPEVLLAIAAITLPLIILIAVRPAMTTIYVARERRRIAGEALLAEWQLRQLARAVMKRMLDEARRHQQ